MDNRVPFFSFRAEWYDALSQLGDDDRLAMYDTIMQEAFAKPCDEYLPPLLRQLFGSMKSKIRSEKKAVRKDIRELEGKDELFETCWKAYRMKGTKKKAKEQWVRLGEEEKALVMPHIKAYVSSRDVKYQRDFERYLRDRLFLTVVYADNNIIYNPETSNCDSGYNPQVGGSLSWNDYYKTYVYTGMFLEQMADGYTADTRPDGARVMLNNGRGFVVWSGERKEWLKEY